MLTFLNAACMTCERCCNLPVTKTICGRSGSGARRPDHDADGLLLEALLVGGDDGVDLSLMSFRHHNSGGPAGIDRACSWKTLAPLGLSRARPKVATPPCGVISISDGGLNA